MPMPQQLRVNTDKDVVILDVSYTAVMSVNQMELEKYHIQHTFETLREKNYKIITDRGSYSTKEDMQADYSLWALVFPDDGLISCCSLI